MRAARKETCRLFFVTRLPVVLSLSSDSQQQVNKSDPPYHYCQRVFSREGRKVVDYVGVAHGFQPSPINSAGKGTGKRLWYYLDSNLMLELCSLPRHVIGGDAAPHKRLKGRPGQD